MNTSANWRRSFLTGLLVLVTLIIYAYGFEITQINLDQTRSEQRQTSLVRILRALSRPDIIAVDTTDTIVNAGIKVPCDAGGFTPVEPNRSEPYMVLTPACTAPGSEITIEGFNFEPDTSDTVSFIPPSGVSLKIGTYQADVEGHFLITVELPDRESEEAQSVRATTRKPAGGPRLSQSALDTWDKIVETVFLALLATTVGTLLSIPISFLAANNIMKPITSPFSSVALSLLAIPLGLALGWVAAGQMATQRDSLMTNLPFAILAALAGLPIIWGLVRWALPPEESIQPALPLRAARLTALLLATLIGLLTLYLVASLCLLFGNAIIKPLGGLGFLGTFIAGVGDIVSTALGLVSALVGAGVLVSAVGRLGEFLATRLTAKVNKVINVILAVAAGGIIGAGIALGLIWLYEFRQADTVLLWLTIIGATIGLAAALRLPANAPLPIGTVIYTLTRTILNGLRSVEALVMAIVFVVWVGIGPFSGTLALALHTIAALAKLYSEQVESIMAGPLEAVQATGATRLQTIIYAVLPQIVPPYISFTMYRWDINVRMSTIIGFVGGGGIGFLLQQNINLLNYRAASTNMLAIAIVVATMDYVSAKLREKVL